jgi:hypothetical protein
MNDTEEPHESGGGNLLGRIQQFVRFAAPIGALVVFINGVVQYKNSQEDDFRRTYWQTRYDNYKDLVASTSAVINASDSVSRAEAERVFWQNYWGEIVMVEDHHVYAAMRDFGEALQRAVYPDSIEALRIKSYHVGQACRRSLEETWAPVPLKQIRLLEK